MYELSGQQILPGDSRVQYIHTLYELQHIIDVAENCSVYNTCLNNTACTKCTSFQGYEIQSVHEHKLNLED